MTILAVLGKMLFKIKFPHSVKLMRRLEDCKIPQDLQAINDTLDILIEKLQKEKMETIDELIELKCMGIIYQVFKGLKSNGGTVYLCISIFQECEKSGVLMLELIQLGCIKLLEEIRPLHESNSFLKFAIPDVIKFMRGT
jgi:hypothetical protein